MGTTSALDPTEVLGGLAADAASYGLDVQRQGPDSLVVHWPGLASATFEHSETGAFMVAVWVRTQSFHWDGDRTDLNELLALVVALWLRGAGTSCRLATVEHPVADIPGEIYATYLVPVQPWATGYPCEQSGLRDLRDLLALIAAGVDVALFALRTCEWVDGDGPSCQESMPPQWIEQVLNELAEPSDNATWRDRTGPTWSFLRTDSGYSMFRSEPLANVFRSLLARDDTAPIPGPTGTILRHQGLRHFVSSNLEIHSERLLAAVHDSVAPPAVAAIENRVIFVGGSTVLTCPFDASRRQVEAENARLASRHAIESEYLYESTAFDWAVRIEGGRFETLVKAILEVETGADRVRFAGGAFEPDQGRDLLLDLSTPLLDRELNPDDPGSAHRVRRVVVQCKADANRVGTSRVTSVADTIDYHGAGGYLLVVRSGLSAPLVDRLERRRVAGAVWVDWWEHDELEERLRRHPHLLEQFSDIVSVRNPKAQYRRPD